MKNRGTSKLAAATALGLAVLGAATIAIGTAKRSEPDHGQSAKGASPPARGSAGRQAESLVGGIGDRSERQRVRDAVEPADHSHEATSASARGAPEGWIDRAMLNSGTPVLEFDPHGLSFDELLAVANELKALEREYTAALFALDPDIDLRLVPEADARTLSSNGAIVLNGRYAMKRGYLLCTASEAEPVLALRAASLRILDAEQYQHRIIADMQETLPETQIQGVVMHDDGFGFDILNGLGEVVSAHHMKAPGTAD